MPPQKWSSNVESSKYITDEMLSAFVPAGFLPTSQVELTLSCKNLLNSDFVTKSASFCKLSMKVPWQDQYLEIARTEVIKDTLNPQWAKKLLLNYHFETIQKIRFDIHDEDSEGNEYLGRFETTLGELVSSSERQYIGQLSGVSKNDCGKIIIVTEEFTRCKQIVHIQFRAEKLTKLSMLTSNDPFLVISRSNGDGSYSVVIKTEVAHKSSKNPTWKPFVIRLTTLCNGDMDRNIKIDCYDRRSNGSHKLIGTCYTNLKSLSAHNPRPMILVNEKKQKTHPQHKSDGILKVAEIKLAEDTSFLDYIRNGTQLHLSVAIDFTESNGVQTDHRSLHYLSESRLNHYEIALKSIGEIIQQYDSSLLFPAFGFGAKIPPHNHVSHQFPLNGKASHPYCSGVDDILFHYRNQVKSIQFYGPNNLAPVIDSTSSIASQKDGKHYFVLLIITAGIISDMEQTKRAILNASNLPMSIIIVGVGDEEFDAMNELNSDEVRSPAEGGHGERDIVQFVPLNKFISNPVPYIKSQADLAKEVLAEVPEQLTSFMKSHDILLFRTQGNYCNR